MQVKHISAARGVTAGALPISAHYKFDMDLTSFLWNAAGNPLWSSVYCTYRGIELASRFTTATLASKLVVIPQVSVWSSSGDLQSFSKALCSPCVVLAKVLKVPAVLCSPCEAEVDKLELFAKVLKVQALCSPLAEVEKLELFAVHVTGLKFENALERNDVKMM
jgi:thiol-disulfide isomerase/thioredoxin